MSPSVTITKLDLILLGRLCCDFICEKFIKGIVDIHSLAYRWQILNSNIILTFLKFLFVQLSSVCPIKSMTTLKHYNINIFNCSFFEKMNCGFYISKKKKLKLSVRRWRSWRRRGIIKTG